MVHPGIVEVMRRVLRERGVSLVLNQRSPSARPEAALRSDLSRSVGSVPCGPPPGMPNSSPDPAPGDREVEDECLILMAQRLQEASGLRLLPWLTVEEGRLCVAGD